MFETRDELTRYHDHRGMFHQTCPYCHVMVILFDDDEHWCDQAEGETVHVEDVDAELSPEALDEMRGDCEDFMKAEWAFVCDLDAAQVGHDFWLTRNGHGTGFWDRSHPEWLGKHLTDAAKVYGSADLYLGDDGQIHHS